MDSQPNTMQSNQLSGKSAGGIIKYLQDQRSSFADEPFNNVDSLILSTATYLQFEQGMLERFTPSERVPFPVALSGATREALLGSSWLSHMRGNQFLQALIESPRFMELNVGYFINEVSSHFEKQFSAITFFFPDQSSYIAFRGTDNTLAGWKEDFNLTFMEEIPSQVMARNYLETIAENTQGPLLIGGHSKGGNLAEYASLTCKDRTFNTIERIFNHDGPGFAFVNRKRLDDDEYRAKLSKTVAESSIFGMLMEDRDDYRIIKSSGMLFAQHATTNWHVHANDFVYGSALGREAKIITNTLNKWARTYEPEERRHFIDTVYSILEATDAKELTELRENKTGNTLAVLDAMAKLPPDVRRSLMSMLGDVTNIFGTEAMQRAWPVNRDFPEDRS